MGGEGGYGSHFHVTSIHWQGNWPCPHALLLFFFLKLAVLCQALFS